MKKILYILPFLILLNSCTKVIDINLNDAKPEIVIEANLIEGTHDFKTIVSQTGNYFGGAPTYLNNATVTLSDGIGSFPLTNMGNGEYILPNFTAVSGATYSLDVTVNGKNYQAISTMPNKINLDTLTYQFQPASAFNDEGYFLFLNFQDPQEENYYRGTVLVNGEPTKGITDLYIFDDQFTNGNYIVIPVFGEIYTQGDVVSVDLYSLTKAGYKYYETLGQITSNSGGGNVAPANPTNNWNNGALGNFNVYGLSSFSGTVQP